MTKSVKVSSKYQAALPADARRLLGIEAGDRLAVHVEDGVIMLIPQPADAVEALRGLGREIWEGVDAQEYVNQLRDE